MTVVVVLGLLAAFLVAVSLYGRFGPEPPPPPPPPEPTFAELMDDLGRQFAAIGAAIAEQLTPAINEVLDAFNRFAEALTRSPGERP